MEKFFDKLERSMSVGCFLSLQIIVIMLVVFTLSIPVILAVRLFEIFWG